MQVRRDLRMVLMKTLDAYEDRCGIDVRIDCDKAQVESDRKQVE